VSGTGRASVRRSLVVEAVPGIEEIEAGMDLGAVIGNALVRSDMIVPAGAVVVVAQKIVSKAEGRLIDLDDIVPSARALELAAVTGKSAALVEMVLRESTEVLRAVPNVLIVRHRLGYVVANAGIDQSNVRHEDKEVCLLLPVDPERSAAAIRVALGNRFDSAPAVIVSDSFGRPWRRGVVNVALGSAGLPALIDRRGEVDRYGRPLHSTDVALADALAAAAGIVMGEAAESMPVVLISGVDWSAPEQGALGLVRPLDEDLFR
jgi:coenzyme F420-0:L-glutamate ligase/coenzyme F420-1:gamma-L-glutamate ligase